jgi:AcrR family transcriptional regulator
LLPINERSFYYDGIERLGGVAWARKAATNWRVVLARGKRLKRTLSNTRCNIAAQEGLGAVSIGRLAKELKMSKSGLFFHFGSRRRLEASVLERARDVFFGRIVFPAEEEVPKGIERVWALCDSWLEFVEDRVLPGGYFFTGAFFECAQQGGSTPTRVTEITQEWFDALRRAVVGARRRGEIRITVEDERTAIELNSVLLGAQWAYLLGHGDSRQARSAILAQLHSLATEQIPASAFDSVRAWRRYLETRPQ